MGLPEPEDVGFVRGLGERVCGARLDTPSGKILPLVRDPPKDPSRTIISSLRSGSRFPPVETTRRPRGKPDGVLAEVRDFRFVLEPDPEDDFVDRRFGIVFSCFSAL